MNDRFKFRVWNKTNGSRFHCIEGYEPIYADVHFLIVEQCTGLRDNGDKLIFEGDIVEFIDECLIGVIKWENDSGCFSVHADGILYTFDNLNSHELNVIGNIHDNPELLRSV